ncbi:LPS translocon maturation chaperone LptM [Legionella pneumophila]|nr:lipoprotein [Legionella pneumophila]AWG45534.1 lipopeptide precursor [Legionella pneumophila subsp. pascullei]HAT6917945.1 lipopeptide precursor [Legionella pneumophila]HAT6920384.1 lipopeptide precursor [Legionella pneumophila]HAT6972891.1 lipopeptide precursor [Legionella pneumophila]HAU3862512.1 lipopeptide precursor [Legionella pneumophila]
MRHIYFALLFIVVTMASLCLSACGQKGPLYLPEPEKKATANN